MGWGAGHQWLPPIILATQEAEIRRIMVQSQPRQIVCETLYKKGGEVAQVIEPLLSKCKALNTTKKKKKRKIEMGWRQNH
jgi:hypothetical protein